MGIEPTPPGFTARTCHQRQPTHHEEALGGPRTRDLQLGKLMLYHLSYGRTRFRDRDSNPNYQVQSLASYQLDDLGSKRETGFEPVTSTMARWRSSRTELLPRSAQRGLRSPDLPGVNRTLSQLS